MSSRAMRGSGRRRRPAPLNRPRSALLAVAAAGVLLVGVLHSQGTARESETEVAYRCLLPSGEQLSLTATVAADFPEHAAVEQPVQPAELTLTLTLPAPGPAAPAPDEAAGEDSAEVGDSAEADTSDAAAGDAWTAGRAALTVTVAQRQESAEAIWEASAAPTTPDADGRLELSFHGSPPPVTVLSDGPVTFTAGALAIPVQPPDAAEPTALECLPDGGDPAVLAAVQVPADWPDTPRPDTAQPDTAQPGTDPDNGGADTGGSAPEPGGRQEQEDAAADGPGILIDGAAARSAGLEGIEYGEAPPCPEQQPAGELDYDRFPEPPPGHEVREIGAQGCTVALGFSTVTKLGGAMMLNSPRSPHLMNVSINKELVSASTPEGLYLQIRHLGELSFPDAESTFLTFGFQPTTARVEFIKEPVTIVTVQEPGGQPDTTVGYYQRLRLYDVKVNGVPLEVGPDCRTASPIDTVLHGAHDEYDVLGGGTLRGVIEIPPFTGCGSGGEDLSPLFTAAISGPDNAVEVNQSDVCQIAAGCTVPAVPPLPRH